MKTKADDLFCLFPADNWNDSTIKARFFTSYAHVGQHSAVHLAYIQECRFATKKEYKDLQNELNTLVGYDLDVFNDKPNAWDYPVFVKGKFQPFTDERAKLRRAWSAKKNGCWDYFLFINELKNL